MKRYYAISWGQYGRAWSNDGAPIGDYHVFFSRAARDAWVSDGAAYQSEVDFREPVTVRSHGRYIAYNDSCRAAGHPYPGIIYHE